MFVYLTDRTSGKLLVNTDSVSKVFTDSYGRDAPRTYITMTDDSLIVVDRSLEEVATFVALHAGQTQVNASAFEVAWIPELKSAPSAPSTT